MITQITPVDAFLIVSDQPILSGDTFLIGEPCPCPAPFPYFDQKSRTVIAQEEVCVPGAVRVTYQKIGEEGDEEWEAAPEQLESLTTYSVDPPKTRAHWINNVHFEDPLIPPPDLFLPSVVASPACGIPTATTEWSPGPPEDYAAFYSEIGSETLDVEETVDANVSESFDGEYTLVSNFATIAVNEDSTKMVASKSEWYWVLDLTEYQVLDSWPDDFAISGTLVWDEVTTRFPFDDSAPQTSRQRFSENFTVSKAERIWEGALHQTMPPAGEPGVGISVTIEEISGFRLWLPENPEDQSPS
jgi:hypothetical protein